MAFYVQIRDGARSGLLAGPFDDREQATELVEPARRIAEEREPGAWFAEYGTIFVRSIYGPGEPYGRLNVALGLPPGPPGGSVTVATVESGYQVVIAAAEQPRCPEAVRINTKYCREERPCTQPIAFHVRPGLIGVRSDVSPSLVCAKHLSVVVSRVGVCMVQPATETIIRAAMRGELVAGSANG